MFFTNKRPIPNSLRQVERTKIYDLASSFYPIPPRSKGDFPDGLENGNKKTGVSGKVFDKVFVWNIPVRTTCPGASAWCNKNCYNLDSRQDVFPMRRWQQNWWWALNNPSALEGRIIQQLSEQEYKHIGVRLHSCGDFYSIDYIEMWHKICKMFPNIQFWGYTRSWAVENLLNPLSQLALLNNVNLFASWDDTMRSIPLGWRKSIVAPTNEDVIQWLLKGDAFICPEQYLQVACCADCGLCTHKGTKNVIFIIH